MTKRTGVVQILALFGHPVSINLTDDVIMQGIDILTTLCYNNSFDTVLGIIDNNRGLFEPLVTKKVSLDDAVEDGIKTLASDKSQVKIMVSPEL